MDPQLYQKLQNTEKEQMSNTNLNRWNNYQLKVEKGIYEKLQRFKPIEK